MGLFTSTHENYWRKQETRQQQPEDTESDENRLSSLYLHCLKCRSCLVTSHGGARNASSKTLQRTTEVIAETQYKRNEICNKAVSPHSLFALFEEVKRSKECTLATWSLTSAGYCTATKGLQLSVHGSKWPGNLYSRHCQEQGASPGVSCKRLREIARARKDTAGKEGDLSSASLPAHICKRGE